MKTKKIKVDYLARVEGEGALWIEYNDQEVKDVKLKIFEPPRFFEGFMVGRKFQEAPDITARICGICPVAYQMSSVTAMEQAMGVQVPEGIEQLRRLLYCGEWLESHLLHIYMLHAPDFLGFEDAIQMAKKYPKDVERGLKMKKYGNEIVKTLGGREIHPINVKVGGFYKLPESAKVEALKEKMKWLVDASYETLKFVSQLDFPDLERDYLFVSLSHPEEYPFCRGKIRTSEDILISRNDFNHHFQEEHVPYTNALHCYREGQRSYMVGPLARFSLNYKNLPPSIQSAAKDHGLDETCRNPFKSILVRSVECLFAATEALRILESQDFKQKPSVPVPTQEGIGYGVTEAPRGMLFHRYEVDKDGNIKKAQIVPPTSQNQKAIEEDLFEFVRRNKDLDEEKLTWKCEQAVRNYDPCISCATHFLKLHVKRN